MPRRYRITPDADNRATLTVYHPGGQTTVREYWAPPSGGSVYDTTIYSGTGGQQVCGGLYGMGACLSWRPGTPLAALIRREMRSRIASNRRRLTRDYPSLSQDADEITGFTLGGH